MDTKRVLTLIVGGRSQARPVNWQQIHAIHSLTNNGYRVFSNLHTRRIHIVATERWMKPQQWRV